MVVDSIKFTVKLSRNIQIVNLVKQGMSFAQVGRAFGVSRQRAFSIYRHYVDKPAS